jgi:hypothetical protein
MTLECPQCGETFEDRNQPRPIITSPIARNAARFFNGTKDRLATRVGSRRTRLSTGPIPVLKFIVSSSPGFP